MKTETKPIEIKTKNCLACSHVLGLQRPVLFVAHDDDNAWKFICRDIGHKLTELKIMPLHLITKIDMSINELHEMPPGVGAKRANPTSKWEPFVLYPDTEKE